MSTHLLSRSRIIGSCAFALTLVAGAMAHGHDRASHDASTTVLAAQNYSMIAIEIVDQTGKRSSFPMDIGSEGKMFLSLFYGDCKSLCPASLATMKILDDKLRVAGRRVPLVSLSIDPENDSADKLSMSARPFTPPAQWHFATAGSEHIKELTRALGLPADFASEAHAQALYVVDARTMVATPVPLNTSIEGMMALVP